MVVADTNYCEWQLVNGYNATPFTFGTATTVGGAIILLAQNEDNGPIIGAPLTVPTSRWGAATWTDVSKTKLWLFGGNGNGTSLLNDLWEFDTGTLQWTFVDGSAGGGNIGGTYSGGSPRPGSRWGAVTWTDQSGNFWLFGGYGYDGSANVGILNDLWKFNGTSWTFVWWNYVNDQPTGYLYRCDTVSRRTPIGSGLDGCLGQPLAVRWRRRG